MPTIVRICLRRTALPATRPQFNSTVVDWIFIQEIPIHPNTKFFHPNPNIKAAENLAHKILPKLSKLHDLGQLGAWTGQTWPPYPFSIIHTCPPARHTHDLPCACSAKRAEFGLSSDISAEFVHMSQQNKIMARTKNVTTSRSHIDIVIQLGYKVVPQSHHPNPGQHVPIF